MKPDAIEPITTLKRDAASLIDRAAEERTPIIITQNGKATAVLQDVESFAEERRAFALLKLALEGEQDIQAGRRHDYASYRRAVKSALARHR
jgi:prevent-host-death family protein